MKTQKSQSKQLQNLVAIFWDYENVSQFEIASDLLKIASFIGNIFTLKAYSCNWNESHKSYLEQKGFECIQIKNKSKIKNAVDFQIVIDCFQPTKTNTYPDIIILVTGDSYSQIVQQNLRQENRKLIVFARKGSHCKTLNPKAFDEFHYIDELPKLVKKLDSQTLQTEGYICYEEAVKCLMQAIKTAVKSQKSATIGYLGKLMHDNPNFPNYKNVASIRKPDGTSFSKFNKFLETLIQKGIIKKVNQEIILIRDMK
ncbi:NYN domain-containing protein [Capilliphycus salinus ALCB114379]|uniref:NYN domain-containing protein n=1 Tax=Capilliphycus salinus TaxID=2768948 RepID=UPI0039A4B29B